MAPSRPLFVVLASVSLVTFLLPPSGADARGQRVFQIPNGDAFGCRTCHTSSAGGPRNLFGMQVQAMGLDSDEVEPNLVGKGVVWANVAQLDADGDGFTNGEELGDPEGSWMIGEDDPPAEVLSHPADPADPPVPDMPDAGGSDAGHDGHDAGAEPDAPFVEDDPPANNPDDDGICSVTALSPRSSGGLAGLVFLGLLGLAATGRRRLQGLWLWP